MAIASRYAAVLLVVLSTGLCVSTYRYFGHTWDEPEHLAAGIQLLDRGQYTYDIQHPPLARLAMALGPYIAGVHSFGEPGPSGEQEGRDLLYRTVGYDRVLTLARLGVLPFLLVMFGAAYVLMRRILGDTGALLATFFLATTPTILGHASVAALDVPAAAMCTLALYLLVRWIEVPSWHTSLLLGAGAGLAVGTKLSAIPFLFLFGIVLLASRAVLGDRATAGPSTSLRPYLGGVLLVVPGALIAVTLAYGGRFELLLDESRQSNPAIDYLTAPGTVPHEVLAMLARRVPLPLAAEKLPLGIRELIEHNREGHLSFLLGEVRKTGWWYFYLVALAVKTPIPLLILGSVGLALLSAAGIRRGEWRLLVPGASFAAVLVFCCAYSRINIGVRHILVLYPLLAGGAAHATMSAWRAWRNPAARGVLAALLIWQASALWTAYPDYLPYFNELAVRRPEAVLIDSDLDWGQDMRRLEQEMKQRNVRQFSFAFRGTTDWIREDLPPFTYLPPDVRTTGWVAVDLLAKLMLSNGGDGFAWLDEYRPVTRVGKTIDLYYIPPGESSDRAAD